MGSRSDPTSTALPNGVTTTRAFDVDDRPTQISIEETSGPVDLATFDQTYSTRSQITQITPTGQAGASTATCTYDPNARLSGCGGGAFDAAGNTVTLDNKTFAHDASGELCWWASGTVANPCGTPPSGAATVTYDDDGARTSRTPALGYTTPTVVGHYSWDGAGRLTEVKTGTTSKATYAYDGDGLRVNRTVGFTSYDYTWDEHGDLPMLLLDETDAYVYGPQGEPLERITATGTTTYLHQDHLGSTRFTTDSSGTKANAMNYSAYGRGYGTTPGPVNLKWAGEYNDYESGLYYLRNRYYDDQTAQFMTPDPLFTTTLDRYGYAAGDPINGVDRTGLCAKLWVFTLGSCPVKNAKAELRDKLIKQETKAEKKYADWSASLSTEDYVKFGYDAATYMERGLNVISATQNCLHRRSSTARECGDVMTDQINDLLSLGPLGEMWIGPVYDILIAYVVKPLARYIQRNLTACAAALGPIPE